MLVKKKKKSKVLADGAAADTPTSVKKTKAPKGDGSEKKSKKKRKLEGSDEDTKPNKPKKIKADKLQSPAPSVDDSIASEDTTLSAGDEPAAPPADPLAVDNFRLSPAVKAVLKTKGIQSLFEIQAQTLAHVLDGKDLLGRARCGTKSFARPTQLA